MFTNEQMDSAFNAPAHETRRAAVDHLRDRTGLGAGELATCFDVTRIAVMHPLRVVTEAGLVHFGGDRQALALFFGAICDTLDGLKPGARMCRVHPNGKIAMIAGEALAVAPPCIVTHAQGQKDGGTPFRLIITETIERQQVAHGHAGRTGVHRDAPQGDVRDAQARVFRPDGPPFGASLWPAGEKRRRLENRPP